MADDSLEILEEHPFHPADPPQGLRNYDLGCLKPDQQRILNRIKMIQRVENENYLQAHPEIRGLISILLRHVLTEKPGANVHETIGAFFTKPTQKIGTELMDYLADNFCPSNVIDKLHKEIARLS